MIRRLALLAALVAGMAPGCAGQSPRSHANAVTEAVCRQRADAVYARRNPQQVYNQDTYLTSTRDAPLGTSGSLGIPNRGLSGEYERQQMISDCLKGAAGNVGPSPAAPASGP